MKTLVIPFIAALSFLTPHFALASSDAQALIEEGEQYSEIMTANVRVRGSLRVEFNLGEGIDPADVSLWYVPSRRCNGFGISDVEYLDVDTWAPAAKNSYLGINHYRVEEETNRVAMTLSSESRWGVSCEVSLRTANFLVPATVEMVISYDPVCTRVAEEEPSCNHTISVINDEEEPERQSFSITPENAEAHKLEPFELYKITGYVDPAYTEEVIFRIISSMKI